ncbi:Protein STU1 [Cyphellophora attinorum]|uniref:Protein STU1 n=1 Tax=Cyphellophora attinorum TaxID=1664694 RepID=A0A0N0NQ69_9EURO|nr:Protein STU1 [Phialophora attinorum]KPI43561.1 Protein STU1 [Phialophora attinorum]
MALQYSELIKSMRNEWENGVEDENNWQRRNGLLRKLAEICDKYDPPRDLYEQLKPFFNHLITTCATERTTLGISALACLSSIFKVLGTQMAPQLDHMLPPLITFCGVTKKLTSKSAGEAMTTVCTTVGYNLRLVAHVCDAFKEKATNSRLFAASWLNHILKAYKSHLDPSRDFPRIDAALITGLQDSQNTVREALRPTYWRYAKLAASNAAAIMDKMPKDKANALRNHPDNPDRPAAASQPARPASALSQIKARSKALKQSTSKPPADVVDTDSRPALNTSTSSITAKPVATMAAAPARMTRSTTEPHPISKARDFTQSTMQSISSTSTFAPGRIDNIDAPDGSMVPLPASPKQSVTSDRSRSNTALAKKKARHGPEYGDEGEPLTSEQPRHDDAGMKHFTSNHPDRVATIDRHLERETTTKKHVDQSSLRNLMAAPVRRPRVVATPISQTAAPPAPVRPSSKGDSKKAQAPSGRQTPTIHSGRATPTEELPIRGHKKQASSRSGRQTPTIREDISHSSHQKKPSVSRAKTTPAAPVSSRPTTSSSTKTSAHMVTESFSDQPDLQTTITPPSDAPKAYEACTGKAKDARSEVTRLKEALKANKLDALGHKKLSGLLKDKPGQLVTTQKDFDDLYTILVNALAANASVAAPPGNSARNPGHPFYNRHALIDSIVRLLEQFPGAGEPQPGMAIATVIQCNATHPDGERFRTSTTIDTAAMTLVRLVKADNVLPALDNVADSFIEYRMTGGGDVAVCGLALRSLSALLARAAALGLALFEVQERLMVDVAVSALKLQSNRDTMGFAVALKGHIRPEERLEALLEGVAEGNLLMYYLARE